MLVVSVTADKQNGGAAKKHLGGAKGIAKAHADQASVAERQESLNWMGRVGRVSAIWNVVGL
jgi:hypothetical protein